MKLTEEYEKRAYQVLAALDRREKHETWLLMNKETRRLFVKKEVTREGYAIARQRMHLENCHFAKICYVMESGDRYYVIEEYISGETLEDLLAERRTLTEEESIGYLIQLLDALTVVHEAGIVHRDVTPSNVVLSIDGVVKLIDFGIARKETEGKNRDTMILGTEGYAAPEQFGFQQTDMRADIYAAGVLLREMLTGQIQREPGKIRPRLQKIIDKATSMDPENRYASASEMKQALQYPHTNWLPGFRSGAKWKVNLARWIYVCCGFFFFIFLLDAFWITKKHIPREICSAFLVFIATPLLLGNIAFWDGKGVLRYLPTWVRLCLRIVLGILVFVIGMELYLGVSDQFR